MSEQEYTEYRSRLGKVAITESHIEREKNDSSDWEALKNFPEQKMVNEIHFSNVKQITYTEGSTYPYIEFDTTPGEKKMFFSIGDPVQEIFKELKEKIAVYRQKYQ